MSRFNDLTAELAAKGAGNPAGLARYIGQHKYGRESFRALQAAGRVKHRTASSSSNRAAEPLPERMLQATRLLADLPVLPLS